MKRPPEPTQEAFRRAFTLCVRHYRLAAGIAQEALAAKAGIDRAYMGGLERGKHMPSILTAYRIVRALEVPGVEFIEMFQRKLRIAQRATKSA